MNKNNKKKNDVDLIPSKEELQASIKGGLNTLKKLDEALAKLEALGFTVSGLK